MLSLLKALPKSAMKARTYGTKAETKELENVVGQRVWLGTEAVAPMKAASAYKRPLLVTDAGIAQTGLLNKLQQENFASSAVFPEVQPNPTVANVCAIRDSFLKSGSDGLVGLGGGGPMDAARAAAFVIAVGKINPEWEASTPEAVEKLLSNFRSVVTTISKDEALLKKYTAALPPLSLIPTTAGTGSDGGKSAVISMLNGRKLVFGHPSLMAPTVALNPAFTVSMPTKMTTGTGVDALLHSLEAYFVTQAAAYNDGLNDEEIKVTEDYALKGVEIILTNLPKVLADPKDLEARQQMQIAALYGAKAFRKGDLGGVHATAHTIGAVHHLHHGEAIARMTVPVFRHNEKHADAATAAKFETVRKIFNKHGYEGKTLSEAIGVFLKKVDLPYGLQGLEHKNDWDNLADIASKDACGTNPVKLSVDDFKKIFMDAAKL